MNGEFNFHRKIEFDVLKKQKKHYLLESIELKVILL
jgi:hypothetical protein